MNHNTLEKTLNLLCRNTNTKDCALKLLISIRDRQREGNPMQDSEWSSWIKEHGFTQGTYSNVKSTLEENGLIIKEKGCFYLSTKFVVDMQNELFQFVGIQRRE